MPTPKVSLSASNKSSIHKFIKWYEKAYEYKSPKGNRVMKGKWNAFLVEVLETLMSGDKNNSHQEVFKKFVESADKTEDELLAEKVFGNNPEKLNEYIKMVKEIKKAKAGTKVVKVK